MIDNNMVIDELWELPVRKCRYCNRPTSECSCDSLEE